MKILIISLAGIGDTLLAIPLVQALRQAYPNSRMDALVMWPGARQMLAGNPFLNAVYQENLIQAGRVKGLQYLSQFRRENYDLSLNTFPQSKVIYRVTARYIHARKRLSHLHENRSLLDHLLVTDTLEQDYNLHCVDNNLNMLKLLGLPIPKDLEPKLYFSLEETAWAEEFAHRHALAQKRVLGIHVGSGKTKNLKLKRWPAESYIAVIKRVLETYPDLALLLFGGPEEKEENDRILRELNNPRLLPVPSRTFKEAAAVLAKCDLFLSVDNVFMHLAAAMKVPRQIVIESPTFNKTIEPYHRPFTLVRNPMVAGRNLEYYLYDGKNIRGSEEHLLACMKSVTPAMVLAAMAEALKIPNP